MGVQSIISTKDLFCNYWLREDVLKEMKDKFREHKSNNTTCAHENEDNFTLRPMQTFVVVDSLRRGSWIFIGADPGEWFSWNPVFRIVSWKISNFLQLI